MRATIWQGFRKVDLPISPVLVIPPVNGIPLENSTRELEDRHKTATTDFNKITTDVTTLKDGSSVSDYGLMRY